MLLMDIDGLRQLDMAAVCALLGLAADSTDPKQFKGDGFRISLTGFKWFDHGAGKGGGGAVDLVMHVKRLAFANAAAYLDNAKAAMPTPTQPERAKNLQNLTRPPTPSPQNLPAIMAYLTHGRGLNADLVQWCMGKGMVYADSRKNCVFRYGTAGAELRGTGAVQWRGVYGTVERGFILPARHAVGVALLESAIDALSYRQLHRDIITVSIAGNGNHKVIQQSVTLAKAKGLPLLCAFDNDQGGATAEKITRGYAETSGVNVLQDRPSKKDWNEALGATRIATPINSSMHYCKG